MFPNSFRRFLAVASSTIASLAMISVPGCAKHHSQSAAQPGAEITTSASALPAPRTWPRNFEKAGNSLVMYAPQIDSWTDFSKIRFRAAIAVTPASSGKVHYGVIAGRADTLVDHEARTVLMTNMDVASRFPGLSAQDAAPLKAMVTDCLPSLNYLDISLDEVLAHFHKEAKFRTADVNLQPPPIFYSDVPAILVTYIGPPQFKPIEGAELMFAVNTNWVVLMDMKTSQYYLLDGDSWITAPDPDKGPWTPATGLPASFSKLPESGNWADVKKHIPGKPSTSVPRVLTSTEPAELILTDGPPDYTPIPGTHLMYISNPVMPLFLDLLDSNYYFLVSGRWFRSPDATGPWTAASADLPAEFAKIPQDSPVGFVLASVPKTQEAQDAILLASIPHKATIVIADAKVTVAYEGTPKFETITGTSMTYAVNTSYQVVFASGQYYCCFQGVWFVAPASTGPWVVCTAVPTVIYTIPPTSPLYNITYVQVYSATPTTVVVGYTAGYSGEYVAATGTLMFGAGMLTGAIIASHNDCWYGCSPCYYSYGCAAHYNYATGCYYRSGGACYGPHGGAGWGSSYNPSTGTWARSGAAYGPSGAHWGSQAYNPWTNTYGQHTGGTNGYKSWGSSYVQRGNSWAESGHQSTARGSTGWAENSSGQWAEGARSNTLNTTVAKSSSGDVYAGHDGNVYKQSGGQWQKYQGNGNWSNTSWNKPAAGTGSQSISSAASESSWASGMQSHTQGAAQSAWNNSEGGDQWKSNWENKTSSGGGGSGWGDHDTMSGLNSDSWSRSQGSQNAFSSWQSRSSGGGGFSGGGGGGGGGGFFGGGGGRWGGGGGGWGGRGGFRR